jgi:hypothetical protein
MKYVSCLVLILAALAGAIDGQVPVAGRVAVSGRVTDAYGDPVLRARVVVETLTNSNTTRMLAAAETDDRGGVTDRPTLCRRVCHRRVASRRHRRDADRFLCRRG